MHRVGALKAERASIALAGRGENIGRAREFAAGALGADHPCASGLVLIVSELVTNSIVHSRSGYGGTVTVVVASTPDRVRVEVTDDGGPGLPRLRPLNAAAESGRGLHLVGALSAAWGWDRDRDPGGTTTTWAEVTA